MPKFTLIKHRDTENDAEVSVTFTTDELGLAKDHFDDFLKASGFELPLEETESDYVIRSVSDWDWDDKPEAKNMDIAFRDFMTEHSDFNNPYSDDVIKFPNRFNLEND